MKPPGAAFTTPADGDMRADLGARRRVSSLLGIAADWATVDQVHGGRVVEAAGPGKVGRADGIVTTIPRLPSAVFTADCLGVVLLGPGTVGVAHAGWRGLSAGILETTIEAMERVGRPAERAQLGPAIGPCCFEVGEEVAGLFPGRVSQTTWGTPSVDLRGAALDRLEGIEIVADDRCTSCGGGPSHRRDRTSDRIAAIGWVP